MAAADCLVDYKMGGAISTMQKQKLEGGKKTKVEGKTSKKLWWKKHNKKTVVGGKPVEKTTKFVQQTTQMAMMFHLQWPLPN